MQRITDCGVPRPRVDIYYETPTSQKREHKDYKSWGISKCFVKLCSLVMKRKLQL